MTTEEKVNIVRNYIERHKYDGCYGKYLTVSDEYFVGGPGEWFVCDDLASMSGNRFMPIDMFYEEIKDADLEERRNLKIRIKNVAHKLFKIK